LQQLASVAGDVLLGKEKIQKVLLSRLTETVVMWLSNEQEFWDVFEDESIQLQPSGLQQLILDMHFLVEIAVCGRYPHRPVQQLVSVIVARAVAAFSARKVDTQRSVIKIVSVASVCWLCACPLLNMVLFPPLKLSALFRRTNGFLTLPRLQSTNSC